MNFCTVLWWIFYMHSVDLQWRLGWSIPFFVLVDLYPFIGVKMVWIDQNKQRYGWTKMSLTVHTVFFAIKTFSISPKVVNVMINSFEFQDLWCLNIYSVMVRLKELKLQTSLTHKPVSWLGLFCRFLQQDGSSNESSFEKITVKPDRNSSKTYIVKSIVGVFQASPVHSITKTTAKLSM